MYMYIYNKHNKFIKKYIQLLHKQGIKTSDDTCIGGAETEHDVKVNNICGLTCGAN